MLRDLQGVKFAGHRGRGSTTDRRIPGLADASMVVLADRWRTTELASFDQRHFRAVAPLAGDAFRLLPGDPLSD